MKTILALIDFSDVTRKVLDQSLALAKAFGSDIALMHVIPEEPVAVDFAPAPVAPDAEMFNARQRQLFALRDWINSHGINATAQQFEGVVVRTLLDQIEQLDPDIVIMGSHGHGALYRLLVGSVTEGVIRHATRQVLVVPSTPATEEKPVKSPQPEDETAKMALLGSPGVMPAPL